MFPEAGNISVQAVPHHLQHRRIPDAASAYITRCITERLVEKNCHLGPMGMRRQHEPADMPMAA